MGYYIQTDSNRGKAAYLVEKHGAEIVEKPANLAAIGADKALVCVLDQGMFEAAGLCFSQQEMEAFADSPKPKTWVVLDKQLGFELAGKALE